MKTLIIFGSKYGGTKQVAEKIAAELGDTKLCNAAKDPVPEVDQFDCIVVGSGLYANSIHPAVKSFVDANTSILLNKKIGIFLAGLENSERDEPFTHNFPEAVLKHASAREMTGGIVDPKTLGFFTRILMRMITKTSKYHSTVSEDKIRKFAAALKTNA